MKATQTIIIIMLLLSEAILCQPDSSKNDHTKELLKKYNKIYELFYQNNEEVSYLWKINLISFSIYNPNFGIEKKLTKTLSFDDYISFSISPSFNYKFTDIDNILNIKYYYNLNRRYRKGKNINGFSGNYFSIGIKYHGYRSFIVEYDIPNYGYGYGYVLNGNITKVYYNSLYSFTLRYGFQRRIGKIGFIEPYIQYNLFAFYKINDPRFEESYNDIKSPSIKEKILNTKIGIKAGFAIDSFKGLRRKFSF